MSEFDYEGAIRSARNQVATETIAHEKRMEFWAGYIAAMEEVEHVQPKGSAL